jgi:hypothetical protein
MITQFSTPAVEESASFDDVDALVASPLRSTALTLP